MVLIAMALELPMGGRNSFLRRCAMWAWISCYVTGHDYAVSCDHGRMFLKCVICGRRSEGWVVHHSHTHTPSTVSAQRG